MFIDYTFDHTGETGVEHSWEKMVENVQGHIKGLNWGYKTQLRSQNVKYFNELASFIGPNTIKTIDKKGGEKSVTAAKFILATGGRPVYPDIPGAKEFGMTSDDIFSMQNDPGKTLLVGASYISLENAGFIRGMGKDVTIMVRIKNEDFKPVLILGLFLLVSVSRCLIYLQGPHYYFILGSVHSVTWI